jgi:hypothetical protein
MAAIQIQNQFRSDMMTAFFTGTFKVALSNTAITATDNYANITEIANGNGYTTGGVTVVPTVSGTAPTCQVSFADVTVTASGGAMATWRYGLIYRVSDGKAIGRFDAGSAQTLASGDSRTLDFDTSAYKIN